MTQSSGFATAFWQRHEWMWVPRYHEWRQASQPITVSMSKLLTLQTTLSTSLFDSL